MRFHPPANIQLRRAQLVLMLATLVPTVLSLALGIVLLALGSGSVAIVAGVLVLAFCTTAITGYVLASIFVTRGASLARVQNDFLSAVSHELRTPLTSMRMFIDTLREERVKDAAERAKCLAIVDQELARLDGLVTRLLELQRMQAGDAGLPRTTVEISDVVKDAITSFDVLRLGGDADLAVDVQPGLAVIGDRPALVQALGNLLANAWKYTPADDKRIALRACAAGERSVEITVSDNGPGIPTEERERIFDFFERGRAATDGRVSGSGLGLALVRAVARAHRGSVEVGEGKGGASFRLVLPRAQAT